MSDEIIVGIGTYHVAGTPKKLVCLGLGSCVAIALRESNCDIGGLAHGMLPYYEESRSDSNPSKYVDAAIFLMVDEILDMGGCKDALEAKIVGGSQMFSFIGNNTLDIGMRNIEAARVSLKKEGIRVVAEDVGGSSGRSVHFDTRTGVVSLRKSGKDIRNL